MGRRSMVLAVGLWLAVVVVVSVATWTVIDAAGRDVTARPASDPGAAGGAAGTSTPTGPSPRATPSKGPRRQDRTPAATGPALEPTTAPSDSVQRPASTSTPRPTTRVAPPAPRPQERTWADSAGSVTARCNGGTISLVSATPANGWRMEVEDRGPSRVRVELRSLSRSRDDGSGDGSDADSGSGGDDRVDVRAACSGGVPSFRVDS